MPPAASLVIAIVAAVFFAQRGSGSFFRVAAAVLVVVSGSLVAGAMWASLAQAADLSVWSSARASSARTGMTVAVGLGACAVCLPLGSWLSRRSQGRSGIRIASLVLAVPALLIASLAAFGAMSW
jgi:hypothetical protein